MAFAFKKILNVFKVIFRGLKSFTLGTSNLLFEKIGIGRLFLIIAIFLFAQAMWPFIQQAFFVGSLREISIMPIIKGLGGYFAFFFLEFGQHYTTLIGSGDLFTKFDALLAVLSAASVSILFFVVYWKWRRGRNPNVDFSGWFYQALLIYGLITIVAVGVDPLNAFINSGVDLFSSPIDIPFFGEKFERVANVSNVSNISTNFTVEERIVENVTNSTS